MPYNEKLRQNLKAGLVASLAIRMALANWHKQKGQLQKLASDHGHKPAELFLRIMEDEDQRIELRLKAATLLDDRMNGRPRQSLEVRD